MEVLASIVGSAVVATGRLLYGCIQPCIKNVVRFQPNLIALEKEMIDLIDRRNNVKQEYELAGIDEELLTTQVKKWLREVEEIELEVNLLQECNTTYDEKFCGCFLRCTLHYRLSRQVAKILEEVERLLEDCSIPAGTVGVSHLAETVKHIPGPSIEDQTTASNTLATTMNLLREDGVRRIGIWGMAGVGKTTLIKNLNNKLRSTASTQPFGIVIWVTVSKELNWINIQTQIAARLRLQVSIGESLVELASRLYERLMKEKKFLLILDDVWETIDLDYLGVPVEIHTGYKIIWTSRSSAVCEEMKADRKVKVDVLKFEEAWQLFTKNAGSLASSRHIKPIAEAIVKECDGLPLALITVGTAMRKETTVELWQNALDELRRSELEIKGIESKVYMSLNLSYDYLHGRNTKTCFLYCSLFPEDYPIQVSELVQCWMVEGLIDKKINHVESLNKGITIIKILKDSSLLEDGIEEATVRMHDVVRDFAKWIVSSMEDGCKSLVQSGIGLRQISDIESLKSCQRISFMNNQITSLPDCVIQCSNTSTLLLQRNFTLTKVPESFLLGFQALKVLNISETGIQSLPPTLTQLEELRALVLRFCTHLEDLPHLGGLRKLQVLDLRGTRIRELPKGLQELSILRQLDLAFTHYLKTIQAGVVSRLFGLEVLDVTLSAYKWGVKGEVEEGQAVFEELECLTRLIVAHIRLHSMPHLDCEDLMLIKRLKMFQIVVGRFEPMNTFLKYDERQVILGNLDLSENRIGWLLSNASNLVLDSCREIGGMFEYLVTESEGLAGLKTLAIKGCDSLGQFRGCDAQHDLLPNLEVLYLYFMDYLECVKPLFAPLGLRFSELRVIEVIECPKLKYLIPHDLIPYLTNLEEIKVRFCFNLEDLLEYRPGQNVAPDPIVPKIRILEVIRCHRLRRLPFTTQNANTIKEIRGDEWWWSHLEWDDDGTKFSLLPYFTHFPDEYEYSD